MKRKLQIFPFVFLMFGVFGVDEVRLKTVTVMEGDSVTLNPDSTQIEGFILIQWRFGASGSVIAETAGNGISYPYPNERFRGRLQLDYQTGSLTIKNMRIKHTGLYQLEIHHSTGSSHMAFSVTVYDSPPVIDFEMKSVMEGGSVTLQTDVTETHGDELIVWRFGDEGKLIAKCDIEAKNSTLYETDERFRDRLKLSDQNGSLTINNIRNTDSGLFTVKISSSSKQTIYKRFNVTVSGSGLSSGAVAGIVVVFLLVFAAAASGVFYYCHKISKQKRQMNEVKTVTVMEGVDVTLKTGAEIQNDDQLVWMFEETPIAEIQRETRETYDGADGSFRDRLELDETTGSLTITNIRTTDSGDYKLQIKSNSVVSYKKLHVIVTGSTGNRGNESVIVDMPLLSKEDVDRESEHQATSSL